MIQTMQLLDEYAKNGSQDAFRQIVERYVDVVYAGARRQVHNDQLAQDVTQSVFFLLARKATVIPRNRPLSAWLLKTTRYVASNAWRSEHRRLKNETRAAIMREADQTPAEPEFKELEAVLDEGISHLSGSDRDALLLKFFERSSLREMGLALGISEDAAQKRVSRAVERLRDFFRKRGVTVSAAVLTTFLMTRAAQAAPASLAALAASAPTSGSAAGIKGALLMTTMGKAKVAAIAAVVLMLGIGGGVVGIQYTSRIPSQAATPAPALPPATPATPKQAAKFSDGTLVELLGIQEEKQADPSKWWGPDGRPTSVPLSLGRFGGMTVNDPGMRNLRFVFQMTGDNLDDKTLHEATDGARSESTSPDNQSGAVIRRSVKSFPPELALTNVRIAVARGPWTDEIMHDVITGQTTNSTGASVRLGSVSEENGRTTVQIYYLPWRNSDRDERLIVISNGKVIAPDGISRNALVTTFQFRCPRSDVQTVIFRSRPFEWIAMNNVSLTARETPTDVQIAPVAPATTKPRP